MLVLLQIPPQYKHEMVETKFICSCANEGVALFALGPVTTLINARDASPKAIGQCEKN